MLIFWNFAGFHTNVFFLQQTQALPASLQQFLRKNPTDVKSEPVEIDIDMDDVVTDDKKEEPVAEAVLSEGKYL